MRQLETDGLLLRGEPIRGKVGQPSVPMRLNPDGAYFFGLKVGRRSTELVLSGRYPQRDFYVATGPVNLGISINQVLGRADKQPLALGRSAWRAEHDTGRAGTAGSRLWPARRRGCLGVACGGLRKRAIDGVE